ncbi:MAG TPA: single-stranded DNA-binding protein [Streptosporangiaceae bacterium]|jgi:single-strand DNA-binding protein
MENMETTERAPELEESAPLEVRHLNGVHVVGRVSAAPEVRPLPGGELVVWRMAVERPRATDAPRRSDWIGCTASEQTPRSVARDLRVGDVAEIRGVLRRRFWRSRNGPMTPLEVEVRGVVPLVRPARRTPASPGP